MLSRVPTVISTFAGCGGSSLGYRWAGFNELLAVDFNANVERSFNANFPDVPFWRRDITEVTAGEVLSFCGIGKGDLDVLDGSPPCQGFSIAGKRNIQDPRNSLFGDFVRLVSGLRPKVFVMENVPGMAIGTYRGVFNEVLTVLRSTGYSVLCRLMNAANHGVPQSRRRLIFIGVRPDLGVPPVFPDPLGGVMTSGDAIDGVDSSDEELAWARWLADDHDCASSKIVKRAFLLMRPGENGSRYFDGKYFNYVKLHPDRPSPTILTMPTGYRNRYFHWSDARNITVSECRRLCSFPDSFRLSGRLHEQWTQLGNSVMPRFMEAVAGTVKRDILGV